MLEFLQRFLQYILKRFPPPETTTAYISSFKNSSKNSFRDFSRIFQDQGIPPSTHPRIHGNSSSDYTRDFFTFSVICPRSIFLNSFPSFKNSSKDSFRISYRNSSWGFSVIRLENFYTYSFKDSSNYSYSGYFSRFSSENNFFFSLGSPLGFLLGMTSKNPTRYLKEIPKEILQDTLEKFLQQYLDEFLE